MKVVAVVQARMSSARLPGKVLAEVSGKPMLKILLNRLSMAKRIDAIRVATSTEPSDDSISRFCHEEGFSVYRGDLLDVRSRFLAVASEEKADGIVRITADCPLVDPTIVDEIVSGLATRNWDYVSNIDPPSYPDGLDVEAFTRTALERAIKLSNSSSEREHVTPIMRSEVFKRLNVTSREDFSNLRWTVDTEADLELVRKVFDFFHPNKEFSWKEVLDLNMNRPDIFGRIK